GPPGRCASAPGHAGRAGGGRGPEKRFAGSWPRRLRSAGPRPSLLPRGRGLFQPLLEARFGDPRVAPGEKGALTRRDSEVARLRVGDDLARIVLSLQQATGELVEAELF